MTGESGGHEGRQGSKRESKVNREKHIHNHNNYNHNHNHDHNHDHNKIIM